MQTISLLRNLKYSLIAITLSPLLLISCGDSSSSHDQKDKKDQKNLKEHKSSPAIKASVPPIASPSSPKLLAQLIFNSLKENDFSKYESIFMNLGDITFFTKTSIKHRAKTSKSKQDLDKFHQHVKKQLISFNKHRKQKIQKVKVSFQKIRANVGEKGGNWESANYVGYHLESRRSRFGVPMANVYLTLKSQGTHFVIKLNNIMRTNRGWIMTEELVFEGTGK